MGYTHYWTFRKPKGYRAAALEAIYQDAVRDCAKIIRAYYKVNGGLSGYTAHTKLGAYGGIEVNGKGKDGHETFVLREHFKQNFEDSAWPFCKTAEKPYDVVVVACLVVLKHRLGPAIDVSSDGTGEDWTEGVKLACRITGLKIKNPIPFREGLHSVS